jgi:hypothetical protein
MAYTAQTVIDQSAKLIGVLASGMSLATEEYTDCLEKLNTLIESWDAEYLNIFAMDRASWPLAANRTTPYTLGPSAADWNGPRPVSIRAANVVTTGGVTSALKLITAEEWSAVLEKGAVSKMPKALYCDFAYPILNIYLTPWSSQASALELFTWEKLTTYATIATAFDLPPSYQRALEFNLALDIAGMFGKVPGQDLVMLAQQSKEVIRGLNAPPSGTAQVTQALGAATPVPPNANLALPK